MLSRPIEILLVEDNPGDVRLTQEAFREGNVRNNLWVVTDGEQALAFLRREGRWAGAPRPDIILLDLHLPKKSGREVLSEIKRDDELKTIPVVLLTASEPEENILRACEPQANCYISKPVELDEFFEAVRSIENFWATVVDLPGGSPDGV
jgi:chemotaxis family two-component system response regulator Rcp1